MPPKKSIYRQAGAQHFQLVHRSVRDPLINDPEASKHVFRPIERGNEKTGVTLSDLEASVDRSAMRPNEGEAATYGITYDDSGYDYMQHLRPVGLGGADSMLLEAPKKQAKGKFKMPEDVLASKDEVSVHDVYAAQEAIPRELQGFQPDMDPHLRQVLEALSDDEFVDDEEEDGDVFGELLGSGQLDDGEEGEEFEFAEWGVDDDERTENGDGEREETWEDRFRAFKAAGGHPKVPSNGGWNDDDVDSAERSEMADTVGSLVNGIEDMMVRGGKKRHGKRGPSDASGMSMSSSNVYRNDNLRTLDDRFDAIERAYEMDDDEEWDEDDDVSIAPSYMSSMSRVSFLRGDEPTGGGPVGEAEDNREDFDDIMTDFLDNYEVVGRRMREAVGGTKLTGPEKLAVIRAALEDEEEGPGRAENRRRILDLERRIETGQYRDIKESIDRREVEPEAKWDVETILSTYTNTENIPGMIRLRSGAEAKERAMRRAEAAAAAEAARMREAEEEEEGSGSETEREAKVTVARPKGEGAAERKARKAAVKAERAGRRAEKKAHTQTFGDERKRQLNAQKKAVGGGRAADKTVGSRGVVSLS
ncbi:hypothetical protein CcaverHIS002_0100870 [Cutaneotrichosporon cavernicola]|uniref:LTV-domain-containing protein n=1 Tax=Cutaneotrichosporon cavernicola TaxID=279322 RepID=A0AA48L0C3_9TREE|nr:uncharacterized protein CcaverHIS019_0100850 [Cutaneotrichosporon cavernicola]BEI79558.1 hypothetical protein CcaverHIS002_0100870 [Cutaneotrichosporon cavernicola]BEI87367.1 hypothetical protein CcaverHIS019_0100850 [Cutaneotrichosporon cavernicola]BEI95136.1 hypothetical protein CcaverHIS631_0100850 [Cutaneotrichosporon cavernicola]BEJ02910.1 hypothetical protein CcaverHIS641_0100850 [Cutaneotrichosporon cavernicola]